MPARPLWGDASPCRPPQDQTRWQTSVGRIGKNLVEQIGRFLSRVDDTNECALVIKNPHNFVQHPMRTEPAHMTDKQGWRGSLDVHKKQHSTKRQKLNLFSSDAGLDL